MSDHPVDGLIQELARSGRLASGDELEAIRRRVAAAPFFDDASLSSHLEKRKLEGQWSADTTLDDYLRDMAEAARLATRIGVYVRRGGCMTAFIAAAPLVVPGSRLGPRWLAQVVVVFSADRGKLISSYQFSELEKLALPKDILWLV